VKNCLLLLVLLFSVPAYAQDELPPPITENDLLPYLEQAIAWDRAISDTEQLPDNGREILLKDKLRLDSKKILQKAFTFARTQSALLAATPPKDAGKQTDEKPQPESRRSKLLKATADTATRIADLEAQLSKKNLSSDKRAKLEGDLKLANAQQELRHTMAGIFATDIDNSGALIDQINALARTAIDDTPPQPASKDDTAKKAPTETSPQDKADSDDGMIKLSGLVISYARKKTQIKDLIEQTDALVEANRNLSASIRGSLREALTAGNNLDAKDRKAYRASIDALIIRYKQLASIIIPLGEMNVLLSNSHTKLQEWNRLIGEDWSRTLRQLVLRIVVLAVAIAIPLVCSRIVHRNIPRYIKDYKRQRQLDIVRKIVVGCVLTFVIMANFITEFGSLATFAGFITAGLAVALQGVLVSLAGHFFFFGRYGVTTGDRITVADVTGDVAQVGMLRIYMHELKETENGFVRTGKIVAFPNSILFQPTAFYKHIPS